MAQPADTAVDHEASDADPRLVASLAAGTAVFLLLTPFVLSLCYPGAKRFEVSATQPMSAPRLQVDPPRDLAAFREAEDRHLAGYGWVDRDHNIVRMPIERALSLVEQRGLPGWQKP
jgi:hypothetical protein